MNFGALGQSDPLEGLLQLLRQGTPEEQERLRPQLLEILGGIATTQPDVIDVAPQAEMSLPQTYSVDPETGYRTIDPDVARHPSQPPLPTEEEQREQFHRENVPGMLPRSTSRDLLSLLADITPVVGDIKAGAEAVADPSWINIGAAGLGMIPVVGDIGGKILKKVNKAVPIEEAISTIVGKVRQSDLSGWFRDGNKKFKPRLVDAVESNPDVKNASLNIFHQEYMKGTGKKMPFDEFLETPIRLFRGGKSPPDEPFSSFSYAKDMAQSHADRKPILEKGKWVVQPLQSITIQPGKTLGMITTMAEGEAMVPTRYLNPSVVDMVGPLGMAHRSTKAVAKLVTGETVKTGQRVKMLFARNTEKAPKFGKQFQQDIEPAGRYLNEVDEKTHHYFSQLPNHEVGIVEFKNPIVLPFNMRDVTEYDSDSWKAVLSDMFGGKKGKSLTTELRKNGHDGIITVSRDGSTAEIVNLHTASSEALN